ncbi:BglG family transcription antiterminator [Vagococcus fluvialis]|uniref:BglG family transcription antiterminator n=1 Tax=Vagococcus fluvialis TaxID=2738 RepID=UPI001D0ACD78|nr:PTS sugar transporter subunit IIA [Vagococcus fluvialis]UDM78529.1 PTS sugar transporter subunit IIA [Vagococcus fluvialis]
MFSQREKKLLQLLFEQKDYQPASFFNQKLNVSTKTIYKDIERIQEKLMKVSSSEIKKIPRIGIKLLYLTGDKAKIKQLLLYEEREEENYSPEYRQLYILNNELFSNNEMTYQEYGEQLFVTAQTIKNDKDELLFYFQSQEIDFSKFKQGEYPESQLQKAIHDYIEHQKSKNLWSREKLRWLFGEELIRHTKEYVEVILSNNGIKLSSYMKQSLCQTLLIFLGRCQIDKHIENERKMVFLEIQNMELYMSSLMLTEKMSQELGIHATTADIKYLSSCLLSHGVEPFSSGSSIDEYFEHEILKLISQMSLLLGVNFSGDSDLPKFLRSHIIPMTHRLKSGIRVRNPLLGNIQKQYSTMFSLVKLAISRFEESLNVVLPDDEIGFLTIHFQLAFEKIEVTKHVLIVCSYGIVTSELILSRIERNISKNIIIEVADEKMLNKVDLTVVDLIISTVPLEELKNEIPIIYVSPLPSNSEISSISSKISTIDQFEQNFSSEKDIKKELIINYLDSKLLFFNQRFSNQKEVLTFLSTEMEKNNIVTEEFKENLFKREAMGSTGMDIGVAFPHADPKTVIKTRIAIIGLKETIPWGNVKVGLVCLVAIAQEDMPKAKDIIATLYDLFNQTGSMKKLIDMRDSEDLINLIVSKEVS